MPVTLICNRKQKGVTPTEALRTRNIRRWKLEEVTRPRFEEIRATNEGTDLQM